MLDSGWQLANRFTHHANGNTNADANPTLRSSSLSLSTQGTDITMPSGVYDLDSLRSWGKKKGWCPYYLTRRAINHANVLVFNYQYMLDPKVAKMVSKELEQESIIVFDEAHNLDNICIEALSIEINAVGLDKASKSISRLSREVANMKATDANRLREEVRK